VAGIGRVCSKQQSSYSKLQERVEDGERYQKERKSGKDNRIHGETEKSTRGSRGSIEKNTGRNEEVCGQKWKKKDQIMLSTKDLVFKERLVCKLVERYVGPYKIEEIVSSNAVKLQLPSSMRIHLVVNVSWIVWYKEQIKGQRKEEGKLVEVKGIEEWEVEKILNKKKIREVDKYLV